MLSRTFSKYRDIQNVTDLDTTDDVFYDESDEGQSDQSDSDESSEDEPDIGGRPCNIVWGLIGHIWYPARVCTVTELPENIKGNLRTSPTSILYNDMGITCTALLDR